MNFCLIWMSFDHNRTRLGLVLPRAWKLHGPQGRKAKISRIFRVTNSIVSLCFGRFFYHDSMFMTQQIVFSHLVCWLDCWLFRWIATGFHHLVPTQVFIWSTAIVTPHFDTSFGTKLLFSLATLPLLVVNCPHFKPCLVTTAVRGVK